MYQVAQNVTDQPVVIDAVGRTVGGLEFTPIDDQEPAAQRAIETGRLVVISSNIKSLPDQSPEALAAQEQAERFTERSKVVASLGDDKVARLLGESPDSDDPRGDLVRSSIDLPAIKKEKVES